MFVRWLEAATVSGTNHDKRRVGDKQEMKGTRNERVMKSGGDGAEKLQRGSEKTADQQKSGSKGPTVRTNGYHDAGYTSARCP